MTNCELRLMEPDELMNQDFNQEDCVLYLIMKVIAQVLQHSAGCSCAEDADEALTIVRMVPRRLGRPTSHQLKDHFDGNSERSASTS